MKGFCVAGLAKELQFHKFSEHGEIFSGLTFIRNDNLAVSLSREDVEPLLNGLSLTNFAFHLSNHFSFPDVYSVQELDDSKIKGYTENREWAKEAIKSLSLVRNLNLRKEEKLAGMSARFPVDRLVPNPKGEPLRFRLVSNTGTVLLADLATNQVLSLNNLKVKDIYKGIDNKTYILESVSYQQYFIKVRENYFYVVQVK